MYFKNNHNEFDDCSRIFVKIRQSLNLTKKELGIRLGVAKTNNAYKLIDDIENGKEDVKIATLHKLLTLYIQETEKDNS